MGGECELIVLIEVLICDSIRKFTMYKQTPFNNYLN